MARQNNLVASVRKTLSRLPKALVYLLLFIWALIALVPIYWMVIGALKTPSMAIAIPPEFVPALVTLNNFKKLFLSAKIGRWTFNSFFVSTVVTAIYLVTSCMAGYTFAKKQFFGKNLIFWLYISTMLVPWFVLLVTSYTVIVDLHWVNSYWALIIPDLAGPFGAFMMRQFIQSLPSELLDAARIDGCSEWGIFWRIVFPLSAPALGVLAVFAFSSEWNSFIWPLTVTTQDKMWTLPVGLASLQHVKVTDFSLLMAGATYTALPMILIFLFAQKYFLKGITVGAIKG